MALTTINWPDSQKALFGTGDDLEIYHSGSDSFIKDAGTGRLLLLGSEVDLLKSDGGEYMIQAVEDGAVSLYHNGVKKLETISTGIKTTGTGNVQIRIGSTDAGGATLYLDGDSNGDFSGNDYSYIQHDTSGRIRYHCDNPADIGVHYFTAAGSGGTDTCALMTGGGSADLYYDGSKKLETTSTGIDVTGRISLDAGAAIDNTPHTYAYATGSEAGGLYVEGAESAIDVVASDGGTHGASLLLRTSVNGAGFNYNPTDNALELKTFVTSANSFAIHASGSNVSDLDTCARFVLGGASELYHNNAKVLNTDAYGIEIKSPDTDNSSILLITGHEAKSAQLRFQSDEGDDNSDLWRFVADTDNIFKFQSYADGSFEQCIRLVPNGEVELYHNNTLRAKTDSWGFQIPNGNYLDLPHDSAKIRMGAGNDLEIFHDGSNTYIKDTNGSTDLIIDTAQNFYVKHSGENMIKAVNDAAVTLYYNNSARIATTTWGAQPTGDFIPNGDDSYDLGASNERWDNIYATSGSVSTSDRNEKNTIVDSDLGLSFVNKLKPVSYKFNGKTRTHYGLIAQDIETTLSDISKSTANFAGFIKH